MAKAPTVVRGGKMRLVRDLIILSRFHKYNPTFTCFAGVWGTLLAGAAQLAAEPGSISSGLVFRQAGLVFLAAYAFCGAGMVWNDWIDRDIDANVARTKDRPLAAGRVTTTEALIWMAVQVYASWYTLDVALGGKDVMKYFLPVALASFLYPFGKRPIVRKMYFYPQYILGFTIAWPAIIGWAAIHGQNLPFTDTCIHCLPICIMTWFWTIYLNTAYSYQDIEDDRKMGVNSLYTLAGQHIKILLIALVGPIFICMPLFLREFQSIWLWVAWMGVWCMSFFKQLSRFDPKRPATGGTLHKSNYLLGVWTIVVCGVEVLIKSGMSFLG